MTLTFVTGNQGKAEYFAKLLGIPVTRASLDIPEQQTLDMREIARDKAERAYAELKSPVVVDDAGIEFTALGRLPGTFTKFFEEEIGYGRMCRLIDGKSRDAIARTVLAYCDETGVTLFEGALAGTIAENPVDGHGFGFDCLFIPEGYAVTRSQLSPEDDLKTYLKIKPIEQLREFLLKK
jgi:non-canonical purine NTP pyrophosphatase (RdgB/HAM1 family)